MNYEELAVRMSQAELEKQQWLSLYADLYKYVIPNRDAFNVAQEYNDKAKPNFQDIYDDTAVLSAYQRANDLHGLLMPQDRRCCIKLNVRFGRWHNGNVGRQPVRSCAD